MERTNESAQKNYISHQIMAKKREFEFDMTEDIDSVEMQRKMRKIEEFEPEKSKKEILKEKKNRKIQRLWFALYYHFYGIPCINLSQNFFSFSLCNEFTASKNLFQLSIRSYPF